MPGRPRDPVDVAHAPPRRRFVRSPDAPECDAGNVREHACAGDPGGDVDRRLFAFAERAQRHFRMMLECVLPRRRRMLAADEDRHPRERRAHGTEQRADVRPLLREHDRDADALCVARNPRDDFLEGQTVREQERVGTGVALQRRLTERVEHVYPMARGLERRGDVGETERRDDCNAVRMQGRNRRRADQGDARRGPTTVGRRFARS